jgi:iron complex transport system permease protein
LATPDTLGISSGAALGAMLAITFHFDVAIGGLPAVPLASFAGSLCALGVMYALAAGRRHGLSTTVLLLAGVTMTGFLSALIMFTQYLADFTDTFRTVRWLMGMLDIGGYAPIIAVLPMLVLAGALLATLPRALDLMSLGTEAAAARGVNVVRAERAAMIGARRWAMGAAVSIGERRLSAYCTYIVRKLVGLTIASCCPARCSSARPLILCDPAAVHLRAGGNSVASSRRQWWTVLPVAAREVVARTKSIRFSSG